MLRAPFLYDDLLGADGAFAPEETGLEAGGDGQILAGRGGRLDVEHALVELVELAGGGLEPADIHAGEDLEQGIDDVVEIGGESSAGALRAAAASGLSDAGLKPIEERRRCGGALGEIVVEGDQIADQGAVEDLEEEAILVAAQLLVEGVEELLVDAVAVLEVVMKGGDEPRAEW